MEVFHSRELMVGHLETINHQTIGFVPTMGALHEGHLSLIEQAKAENHVVVCSIFVNPTQFDDANDLANYPKTIDEDLEKLEKMGCDVVFLPKDAQQVYQNEGDFSFKTYDFENVLEGEKRKGHFEGVKRVVSLLFQVVRPNRAYFGLKDFQQYKVICGLVADKKLNIEIVGCPIKREKDNLAMSSRNVRLTEKHRKQAPILYEAMRAIKRGIKQNKPLEKLIEVQKTTLNQYARVDYLCVCRDNDLAEVKGIEPNEKYHIFVAVYFGQVRLIDNMKV